MIYSWPQWIQAVLAIARSRSISVAVTYPKPTWATFNWVANNGSRYGTAGAGAEFISLTTPEEFTVFWVGGTASPTPSTPARPVPGQPVPDPNKPQNDWIGSRGRVIPRVPVMAAAQALKALFGV